MVYTINLGRKPFTDIVTARNFAATFPAFTGTLEVTASASTYILEGVRRIYPPRELAIHNLTLFRALLVEQENRVFRLAYQTNRCIRLQILDLHKTTAYRSKILEWDFLRDTLQPYTGFEWARYLDHEKNVSAGWACYNESLTTLAAAAFVSPKQIKFTLSKKSLVEVMNIPEGDLVPYNKFWQDWSFVE